MEGPAGIMSGGAPTPAPQSFYPPGTATSTFGTFAAGAGAAGAAGLGAEASRRNQDAVEDMEDPFADPVWNTNDSPVRGGGTTQPLLGPWGNTGSPQRPGTRGSGMSRFREDVV